MMGRNLLSALLADNPDCRVTVLVRRSSLNVPSDKRVSVVEGDLSIAGLGLAAACRERLRASVTEIVHCGADIRFNLPMETARSVNVSGTAGVLQLARECGKLQKLAHISTTFVAGRYAGVFPEAPFTQTAGFFSSYQESKYEAEQLVIAAARELPVAVFRLSSVIGRWRTGVVEQMNHFHQLLRLVPCNPLPVLPCSPEARIDFVASDWATSAISVLMARHFESGSVWNLCAGARHSLPVAEVIKAAFSAYGRTRAPELVTPEEFDCYTAARLRSGDLRLTTLLEAVRYVLPYFFMRQDFENQRTLGVLAAHGVPFPNSRELLERVLRYCVEPFNGPGGTSAPDGLAKLPSSRAAAE